MRFAWRAALAVTALISFGAGGAVLASAVSNTVGLNPGDTATVTCSGTRLSSTTNSATSRTLSCTGSTTTTTTAPTTTTTAPPTTTTAPTGGSYWQPSGLYEFQWYLGGEVSNPPTATQLGTGKTAFNKDTAPATDPTVIDVDGMENTAADVAALHALGDKVVCYIEVGTAGNYGGNYTTYYDQFSAAGDLGNKLSGYNENFLNINAPTTVSIVESIIHDQCAAKGFDAVETDLDETFGTNEGTTGFTITEAQEESYLEGLAGYMHGLGMAWVAKDLSDTGDQSFVSTLEPYAQALIDEQANQYGTIGLDSVFTSASKPVFDAEYQSGVMTAACAYDDGHGIMGTLFNNALNGPRTPCE